MTNAWMWNHSTDDVYRTIDSLLYENIPGKIISKTAIMKNGYRGFDITNRTRRGDLQRYNIFITPFEILFFKIGGNGDYVKSGTEVEKFFGSIQLKEYKNAVGDPTSWKKYSPSWGGFTVELPHEPYTGNDGSRIYDAADKTTGTHYRVMRTDIHNYHFVEEDTFDLSLMEESFASSEFIDTQLSRKQTRYKGYPALDCKFRDKNGAIYLTRFIIQGPHYYSLIAHGKQESPGMTNFLNSFAIKPVVYGEAKQQKDTSLYFTVTTPVFPEDKKIQLGLPGYSYLSGEEDDESEDDMLEGGAFRSRTISNDSTGEKIFVTFYRSPRYYYITDSSALDQDNVNSFLNTDSSWIVRYKKKTVLPGKMKILEVIITDTGSSRVLWGKSFYKDGVGFSLATQTDTLTQPSAFLKRFFESFTPADTLKGVNPFIKKSPLFFEDFASSDSVLHKRAVNHIGDIDLDSSDLLPLSKAIGSLNWNDKKYLDTKTSLINKLGDIKTYLADDYLRTLYYSLDDTVELQYSVLENLLQHKTAHAYSVFRDIINTEPPVLEVNDSDYDFPVSPRLPYLSRYRFDNGKFLDELSDTLQLTRAILPDLLPLLNLDDYKSTMMKLLGEMVDSNLVTSKDYDLYFSKFLIEAKQELKKQSIAEKKKSIEKAEEDREKKKPVYSYYKDDKGDKGNDDLSLYATLLLPYWESNASVPTLIRQMLSSNDKRLKYNTTLLLVKHNKPFPDSMLRYFAGMDEFRYELYSDLKEMKKQDQFPAMYNNHLDLGKSWLLDENSYDAPDSLVYIDRVRTEYDGQKGFIYFYKYKTRKDDLAWKLAAAGLMPEDPKKFEFEDSVFKLHVPGMSVFTSGYEPYSFTGFSDTKLDENEPVQAQLQKILRKMLYSRRKSAKSFYKDEAERMTVPAYMD
jgi:hypothetical protein